VIDRVVADQEAHGGTPSLRYVFHEQIFWRRLEKLAEHERRMEKLAAEGSSARSSTSAACSRSLEKPGIAATDDLDELTRAVAEFHALGARAA
jgi:hypothetical protein